MKKTTLALICFTLLLSACGNEIREPEETDLLETTAAAIETASAVSETADETSSETETEPSKPVIVDERESVPEGFAPALDLNDFADEGYSSGGFAVSSGDILLVDYVNIYSAVKYFFMRCCLFGAPFIFSLSHYPLYECSLFPFPSLSQGAVSSAHSLQ